MSHIATCVKYIIAAAIHVLESTYRGFELELNHEKTACFEAPSVTDKDWPAELRAFKFPKSGKAQITSIERYFTKSFTFQASSSEDSVLDYAVKRTRDVLIDKSAWPTYEVFLLKAARANALCIPVVVQIFSAYKQADYSISNENCQKFIEDIIQKNASGGFHSEVAWVLFLARSLRIPLSKKACDSVTQIENAVCALLVLDLREEGLTPTGLNTATWETSMSPGGLKSDMWLLAYEADLKGWLPGTPHDFVDVDAYFSVLKSKKISFYDKKRSFELKPGPSTGRVVRYVLRQRKGSMEYYAFLALASSLFKAPRKRARR